MDCAPHVFDAPRRPKANLGLLAMTRAARSAFEPLRETNFLLPGAARHPPPNPLPQGRGGKAQRLRER